MHTGTPVLCVQAEVHLATRPSTASSMHASGHMWCKMQCVRTYGVHAVRFGFLVLAGVKGSCELDLGEGAGLPSATSLGAIMGRA
jgi:hypothetical protein